MKNALQGSCACMGLALAMLLCACHRHELSPEQAALVQTLKSEADGLQKDIAAGEAEQTKYQGGLLRVLIDVRLEVSRTTLALVNQRIQALEAGSPVTIVTLATAPDEKRAASIADEITKEQVKLEAAEQEATKYSGGLLQVMALTTVATEQETLAVLRQQMAVAKFGLALPTFDKPTDGTAEASAKKGVSTPAPPPNPAPVSDPTRDVANNILAVSLTRKTASKVDYQDVVLLDLQITAAGLDKKARAIKGVLNFMDLFDEPKFHLTWSIDKPISPGEVSEEKGGGFKYNQFDDAQQWVRNTDISDMKVNFTVKSILYEDGTRRDLE